MANWKPFFRIPRTSRMTHGEYRANIDGINIVFGAVLGFVLAGAEAMSNIDFVYTLILSAGVVVTILYLGSSPYPIFYGAMAIAGIVFLPWMLQYVTDAPALEKLQPTLAVWAGMVMLIEVMPREGRELPPEAK